jgi:TolB-like protein
LTAAKAQGRDALVTADIFLFEEFRFDRQDEGLSRRNDRGVFVPMPIGVRALDILNVLVERSGSLVTREEIIAAVWGRTVVENANLTVQIAALRRVLDEGRSEKGSCIQTVAARGYRFLPTVTIGHPALRRERSGGSRSVPPLSIVVLPFASLTNDPEQRYFADGITDDLTTDLSRIENAFVISRNTAFTYRDKPVDAKQIGRELGVRYVLEGSVRRSADQIRVNAQLIDAETAAHIWAERFDRTAGDLSALQDEITSRIAIALNFELLSAEAARPAERPDALDFIFRGRAAFLKPPSRNSFAEAITMYERALAIDPGSVMARSLLGAALAGRVISNNTDSAAADIERAKALSEQALAASPRSQLPHFAKGMVLRAQRRYLEAIPEYETVLASNRNWVYGLFAVAQCKLFTGSLEETIPLVEQAIRLSPRDPQLGVWCESIGLVHLLRSRTEEAVDWLEKARNHSPALPIIRAQLASAYALKGATERAGAELAEARRLSPDDRFSSLARLRSRGIINEPKIRALAEATYYVGLHKAGVPEE